MGKNRDFSKDSPVFIVGAPRSGTSLLYRMLQGHSRFAPRECTEESRVELTETDVFSRLLNIDRGVAIDYMLGNEALYQKFLDKASCAQTCWKFILGRRKIRRLYSFSKAFRRFSWRIQRNDKIVRSFFELAKEARGMNRILEKTPTEIFFLPEVKTSYPDAKLLYVCRHPVDVYSSYKRRKVVTMKLNPKEKSDWLEISVEEFCGMYSQSVKLALEESRNNSFQFMILKYEDLVDTPQDIMASVCEFLDERFEPEMIPQDKSKSSDWKVDPHLFASVKKKTKKWETYVSATDAKSIERRLASLMEKLRYPNYTD